MPTRCARASGFTLLFAGALSLAACTADPSSQTSEDPSLDPGEGYWAARCASCHGDFGGGAAITTGDANGDFRLDAAATVQRRGDGLEAYIERTMPFGAPDQCGAPCAADTAAYIRGRLAPPEAVACDDEAPAYGVRKLELLSSGEYQRALEDLLSVDVDLGASVANNDGARGGFANMAGKSVNGATLDRYVRNAEAVAEAAVARGMPFVCTPPEVCAQRFVDEFLFLAFRGPVSDEQRAAYAALFAEYPEQGMQLALEAALTSPYFLYRVEAGVDVETALARGYYTNAPSAPETPAPSPAAEETIVAAEFPVGTGHLEGAEWALWENGGIDVFFATPLTDPTTIEVEARGTNYGAMWPDLVLSVGGVLVERRTVDHTDVRKLSFEVRGHVGQVAVRIAFDNDAGEAPWGPGQDVNLYLRSVGIRTTAASAPSPELPVEPEDPAPSPLEGVADDAYVLTPYELASTLAFSLTGGPPDRALLEAARADQLTSRAQIEAQVVRLVDSPRGKAHFGEFVTRWFGLDAVTRVARPNVPELTSEVKAAMVREVEEHFWHVFYDEAVPFAEFLGGNYTFLNRTLADFYGVQGDFTEAYTKVEVEGRGGPLASGAFMAANAHAERTAPILRAVHARQTALCQYVDPPNSPIAGDDIDAQRAAAQALVTAREEAEGTLSSRDFYFLYTDGIDACAGCHEKIINPNFGMEDFDNVGRLRPAAGAAAVIETIDGQQKVVSISGTLHGIESTSDPASIEYQGAKDLSNQIADTDAAKACLVRRGFRFATGLTFHDRDLDTANQESLSEAQRRSWGCVAERMQDALREGGDSPRAMFISLATENFMRLRR